MSCYECLRKDYCPYIHQFNHDKKVGCIDFQDKESKTYITNTLNMEEIDYPSSITVTLTPKYNKIIRDYAKSINKPLNQIIIEAVKEYLNDKNL